MRNLSRQIYAAPDTNTKIGSLHEAEIIPVGEAINEKKKIEKLASKYSALYEHDNIPLPGFTLVKTGRKRFGSLDQTWLVIDPRGFLVRITNENLEKILEVTGITEGLIQDKCVWIRQNSRTRMTLIPVSSDEYKEALENTVMLEDKVTVGDVQVGDKVLLQNKHSGIYLGAVSLYGSVPPYSHTKDYAPHTYPRRQIVEVEPGKYYYQSSLKFLKILERTKEPLDKKTVVDNLNKQIAQGAIVTPYDDFAFSNTHSRGMIRLASAKPTKVTMSFEEVDIHVATAIFNDAVTRNDIGELLLTDANGDNFLAEFDLYSSAGPTTTSHFQVLKLENKIKDCDALVLKEHRKYWSQKNTHYHSLTDFKKFYKIVKHVGPYTY